MSTRSLRLRLLLLGAVSVALALIASTIGLVILFERHVERRVDAELNAYLNQLIAGLDRNEAGEIALVRSPSDPRFERPLSGLYWQLLIEPTATTLRSRSLWDGELMLDPDSPVEGVVRRRRIEGPGAATLYLVERHFVLPVRLDGAPVRAAVALDSAEISHAVRALVADMAPYLTAIGALLVVSAWTQVTVGLRPLAAVREALTRIRDGRAQRLGAGFPDEVKPLAVEIDALLDASDAQIAKARARAGDLAHGLKTPLQVLAGEADRLMAKGEREIAAEVTSLVSTMHLHIEHELTRARLAAGALHARANVRDVADRVIKVVRRTPAGRNLIWSIEVARNLQAPIDAVDLGEALGNLIENAARHARSRVTVSGCSDRDGVTVAVSDDGPGIPADRIEEALSRGVCLDTSSPGTGLGLAIVAEIAEAWGACVSITDQSPGLKASLRFRRA
jgi:signal transduction histidine kinase